MGWNHHLELFFLRYPPTSGFFAICCPLCYATMESFIANFRDWEFVLGNPWKIEWLVTIPCRKWKWWRWWWWWWWSQSCIVWQSGIPFCMITTNDFTKEKSIFGCFFFSISSWMNMVLTIYSPSHVNHGLTSSTAAWPGGSFSLWSFGQDLGIIGCAEWRIRDGSVGSSLERLKDIMGFLN